MLLGIITSYSLPPYNFFFINFISFPIFFYFYLGNYRNGKISSFLIGWFFGFGYFISNLYWLTNSLTFDQSYKNLIPLAIISIPSFLGLFFGIVTFICYFFKLEKKFISILIFSLVFSLIEYLRGFIFGGFPWNLFVYSFSGYKEFLQILSLFGTHLLNLFVIIIFLIPSIYLLKETINKKHLIIFITFVLIIINHIFGSYHINKISLKEYQNISTKIKVIAPKIEIERYLYPNDSYQTVEELVDLSDPNQNEKTIFIFPEGTLTGSTLNDLSQFKSLINKKFSENHKIILGINITEDSDIFNSLVVLSNKIDVLSIYNKKKLVPFGEFLPFEELISKLGFKKITQGYQSFSPGKERQVIKLDEIKFLPLICYEIIYSGELNEKKEEYDFILNISEDGWFKNSIGLNQHFVHSKFRAIEEGKNLIRVANNGTSALINPSGKIIKKIKSTNKGVFEVNSFVKTDKTIFSMFGNKLYFYFVFFYITLIFFLKFKGR